MARRTESRNAGKTRKTRNTLNTWNARTLLADYSRSPWQLMRRLHRRFFLVAGPVALAGAFVDAAVISPWLALALGIVGSLAVAAAVTARRRHFQQSEPARFLAHGEQFARQGRLRAAERVYRQTARSGNPQAVYELARMRHRAGNFLAARDLYWQALDAGHPSRDEIFGMLEELEDA